MHCVFWDDIMPHDGYSGEENSYVLSCPSDVWGASIARSRAGSNPATHNLVLGLASEHTKDSPSSLWSVAGVTKWVPVAEGKLMIVDACLMVNGWLIMDNDPSRMANSLIHGWLVDKYQISQM